MGSIALEGLEFFAYHGVHREEHKIGNRYTVDIEVGFELHKAGETDNLSDTIDYGELYEIVKNIMQSPVNLLEHIAQKIIQETQKRFDYILFVKVAVAKHNPPIGGLCKVAKVRMEKIFEVK